MTAALQIGVLASVLIALACLAVVTTLTVVAALRSGGRREDATDDDGALAGSRFTMPVSVIIPLGREDVQTDRTIAAALAFEYPEFEVIVVADRLDDEESARLRWRWGLSPQEYFYREVLTTAPVSQIYRSTADRRLVLIHKAAGGVADAWNCGVNLAQYRYVVGLDPALTFDPQALLGAMTPALRDPADVVAVSTHIERVEVAATIASPLSLFQRLASVRELMETKLGWQGLAAGIGPHDGVVVWRRDAIVEAGGFSTRAADPSLDMMGRLQADAGPDAGRVARQWDLFGSLPPVGFGTAVGMAARRQRAVVQTVWGRDRRPLRDGSERAGALRRALRLFVRSEILWPLAGAAALVSASMACVAGWLPWMDAAAVVVVLSFGQALTSAAALLVRGALPAAPTDRDLRRLIVAGPLEFVCYTVPAALGLVVGR